MRLEASGGARHVGSRRSVLAVLAAVGVLAAACSSGDEDAADARGTGAAGDVAAAGDVVYPGDDWARTDPGEAGLDAAALDTMAASAEAAGSTCLVVTKDGEIVDERYWGDGAADAPREAFSVTKSITSTLVGIAEDAGDLEVGQPAADHIPEWQDTPAAEVTIEDLLSNDSGRHWDLATDYGQLIGARDKNAFGIGLAQDAPPGEVWAYNNSAIQTLSAVLEQATGESPQDFAERELFEPTGMAHSEMTLDGAGNTVTFMGLQTTCLDLARFGYLVLHEGEWDGEQVVSADYVARATGRSSTPLNAGYGWLFWLNRRGPLAGPVQATTGRPGGDVADGQLVPGAPEDAFWALGFNDQVVAVVPSEGIVAVRMGAEPPADAPFGRNELTAGVLAAAGEPLAPASAAPPAAAG